MTIARICFAALLVAGLGSCDRSKSPSQQIERVAEDAIGELKGETLPRRAQGPLAPREECLDQPGAGEFLANLRRAVEARDEAAFLALAADDIILDFGGGTGKELLRERLNAEDGYLWDALDQIMTLGCASDGASMTLPWYFAQDIPVDPFVGAIVTGEGVPLRASPSAEAEELAQISWDVVEVQADLTKEDRVVRVAWVNRQNRNRLEGFIDAENLRSIIDYRVIASRRNDRWRITNFVAGD